MESDTKNIHENPNGKFCIFPFAHSNNLKLESFKAIICIFIWYDVIDRDCNETIKTNVHKQMSTRLQRRKK